MKIEIVTSADNNPVAEYFSSSSAPETDAVTSRLFCNVSADFARKLKYERDEAREALEEEKKFHHRTHRELVQTQCKVFDLTQAIIATLEENRHLADGDDCTLAKLKSVVPDWK